MNTEHHISLVEKYFDQQVPDKDLLHFNEQLETDDELKSLFEDEVNLHKAIRFVGLKHDLQYLQEIEKKLESKQQTIPLVNLRWVYYAAASIAVFMLVIWLVPVKESPEELFAKYYRPYQNIFEPTLRGAEGTTSTSEAYQAYSRGDYQKAANLFTELLKEKPEPGMLLLLGNAQINTGNIDDAKKTLETLLNDFDDLDIQAKWYLSLCFMKQGNMDAAKKLLDELNQTDVSYAIKAKELLKKVK